VSRVAVHQRDDLGSEGFDDTPSLIELVTPRVFRSRSRRRSHSLGLRVLSPLLLLLLWWALARASWLPAGSLPTPYTVLKTFGTLSRMISGSDWRLAVAGRLRAVDRRHLRVFTRSHVRAFEDRRGTL